MRYRSTLFAAVAALSVALGAAAQTDVRQRLADIGTTLVQCGCYTDSCRYEVLLPTLEDPIAYGVWLTSEAAPADTLAPCSYIIRWSLATPSGINNGFSAYFGGDHFRFSNRRLQEYHATVDISTFAPSGATANGVQRRVQFADLLPQFIGERFLTMASDTAFSVRIADVAASGRHAVKIDGVQRLAGCDAQEFEYILDAQTLLPLSVELENNPGQLGEQTVTVRYFRPEATPGCSINMESLVALEPEAFEKYRTDTYSLEQLVGAPVPLMAVPAVGGSRYIHHRGEPLEAPTVFVFADSRTTTTPQVVAAVRRAVQAVPGSIDVVWMFADKRADEVVAITGDAEAGETLAFNAGSAIRDLGVGSLLPVIVFANRAGKVADFIRGYNNDLESVVIQKASLTALDR